MSKALTPILSLSLGLFLAGSARAQLLLYEGFDYPAPGPITNQNGGIGWSFTWNGGGGPGLATVVGSSLIYSDGTSTLPTVGGSLVLTNFTSNLTINPQRTNNTFGNLAAANGAAPGTLWMSYLWQGLNTTTGAGDRQATMMLLKGTSEYLDLGMPNVAAVSPTISPNFSLWGANGNIGSTLPSTAPLQSSVAANDGSTLFVVMEMVIDQTTASDTLYVWLNPSLSGAPSLGSATFTFSGQDLTPISTIRFQSSAVNTTYGTLGGQQQVDELRVGDTFGDLVSPIPEPSSAVLGILGGLALLSIRRRTTR